MSWLRSAVYRAVEAGGNTSLTRTVRNYADTVVIHAGNAVAEGAMIISDRIGAGNMKSFRLTAKRLEEVSVSCRGEERVQLLRRWLVALKEIERLSAAPSGRSNDNNNNNNNNNKKVAEEAPDFSDESRDSPRKPIMVYYLDPDLGTMNFRGVFLYSQALEGITLSVILEAPNQEEVTLLLEIFGLCLRGGKEVHRGVMGSIQDLAAAFSHYKDEVLVKREELLQYAQGAIAGLKINADVARIDAEACRLKEKLDKTKDIHQPSNEDSERSSDETNAASAEALKETLGQIQLCSTLEALLLKKKSLSNGDSPRLHMEKVDKLKVLSESLLNSTLKAERRILDHRSHKEEALNFRVAKTNEVSQIEKELAKEIEELEKHKKQLEAELKKVNSSLTTARARLRNAKEEREQFDEASNEILLHLEAKEDELSRSINSYRVEADVVNVWIHFLEETWLLQTAFTEQKEKQVNGDLEQYGDYFVNLVMNLLAAYKQLLGSSIIRIRGLVGVLLSFQGSDIHDRDSKAADKKDLVEEYQNLETKFLTTLKIVVTVRKQFYTKYEGIYRKENDKVQNLFSAIDKLKEEFESIERPVLEVQVPAARSCSPSSNGSSGNPSPKQKSETRSHKKKNETSSVNGEHGVDVHVELDNLSSEFEREARGYSSEDFGEWEYDEFISDVKGSN